MLLGPIIHESFLDRVIAFACKRTNHFGAKRRYRKRGEITCERCYQVIGYWRHA